MAAAAAVQMASLGGIFFHPRHFKPLATLLFFPLNLCPFFFSFKARLANKQTNKQ